MRVRFWGVRGSLPAARADTRRYGGNTPCLEVRAGEHLFLFDAGTGIQALGQQLSEQATHLSASLLFSHYHWDHLQGLPFFQPLYTGGNTLQIYGPRPEGGLSLEGVLREVFRAPFFPVSWEQLRASSRLEELDWKSTFVLGGARLRTCRLNHPQGSLAYRIEHGGASLVYATDHEPGDLVFEHSLRQLARGADLLILDAQFTPAELEQRPGFGHGSWQSAAQFARTARVKQLLLFHHDPGRSDAALDEFAAQAQKEFPQTAAAREGLRVEISKEGVTLESEEAAVEVERAPTLPLAPEVSLPVAGPGNGSGNSSREAIAAAALAGASKPEADPEGDNGRPAVLSNTFAAAAASAALQAAAGNASDQGTGKPNGNPADQAAHWNGVRLYPRLALEGSNAFGVLANGGSSKVVPVVDLSFGGFSFLLEDAAALPDVFHARLHVPVLPAVDMKMHRVYARRLTNGQWRVGCRFFD